MKKTFLGFLMLLGTLGMGASLPAQVLQQTFTDTSSDFQISTSNPQWHLSPETASKAGARSVLRFESAVDQFTPNVTVQVMPVPEDFDFEKWLKEDLEKFPKTIQVLEKNKINFENYPGYEIVFHDSQSDILFRQRIFIAKGKRFLVTSAVKKASAARFQNDFMEILNSFKILP